MDKPTAHNHWRTVVVRQGRTLRWLALATGKSPRTVYAYSRGELVPQAEWLAAVAVALGEEVSA
jgi:hypothetical protein